MSARLFEDLGPSRATFRPAFPWPVSVALHLAFVAGVVAASTLAGVELPEPTAAVRSVVRLPVSQAAASLMRPLSGRPGSSRPRVAAPRPIPAAVEHPPTSSPETLPDALPSLPTDGNLLGASNAGPECEGCQPGGDPQGLVGATVGGMKAPARQPMRISSGVRAPRKLRTAAPVYPPLAIAARVEGRVLVDCVIGADGNVTDVRVVQGHPLLAEAAAEAVRQWRYEPTLLSGEPVAVIMTVTVDFRLSR
jgi:periplasmic protein TonB